MNADKRRWGVAGERGCSSLIPHPSSLGARRGFTLTEMLVVIAITAILLSVLFVPLVNSLNLSRRSSAMLIGQDNVRTAMQTVTRDLQNAMEVLEPRPLAIWAPAAIPSGRNRPKVVN